ncbi:unnamed protein product, partial [Brenthis ino]
MADTNLLLQCLLGMQCKDFAIIAADQLNTQSVVIIKNDVDKIFELSDKLLLGVNGDAGDMAQFSQYIAQNLQLYEMKNKYQLAPAAVVHFTRKNMTDALRSGNPTILNMLFASYDEEMGSQLYTMDFLASCVNVPYASHGIGGLLGISILDNYYRPTLSELEAYEVIKLCIYEIQHRLFMNLPNFKVKTVSKDGVKTLPDINTATFVKK